MKILLEWPRSTTYNDKSFAGGVEKWTSYIFKLLKESEHEVTLLAPNDTITDDPNVMLGPVPSRPYDKETARSYEFLPFYEFIESISDNYDKIFLVSMMTSKKQVLFSFNKKVVYVQHYYESMNRSATTFQTFFNQINIIHNGGIVAKPNDWVEEKGTYEFEWRTVGKPNGDKVIDVKMKPEGKKWWMDTYAKTGLYNTSFNVVHYLDDAAPLRTVNAKKVIFVGRPIVEKGFIQAAKAFLELVKLGYECHIFTRDEKLSKQKTEEVLSLLSDSEVQMHINMPHAEIMDHMADTNILFWPTKKETVGLVGYEGLVHGCRVVYKHRGPDCYMDNWGFKEDFLSNSSIIEAIQKVEKANFDRDACAAYFREEYTMANDLKKLNVLLQGN